MLSGLWGWHLAVLLLVILVLIAIVVLVIRGARRAKRTGDPTPLVSLTLSLSAAWAALSLVGAVITVVSTLLSTQVTMTVPVRQYWPEIPGVSIDDGPTAAVAGGGFTSAQLTLEGLGAAPRVLWAIGQGVGILIPTAIATLIAVACFQLLAGRAFAPVVARTAVVTALVVLVGGLATQVLCGIAGSMASTEALQVTGAGWTGFPDDFMPLDLLPSPTFAMPIDFWPVGAALGFAALAAVFRYGSRLQRDTEGLV